MQKERRKLFCVLHQPEILVGLFIISFVVLYGVSHFVGLFLQAVFFGFLYHVLCDFVYERNKRFLEDDAKCLKEKSMIAQ
jgi:hypothetical protein